MFAWESVVMVRKAAIVMIGSLVKDEYDQTFASVSLLVVVLFLHSTFQPYEKRLFNFVEAVSLVVIMLTQLISMFFLRSDSLGAQCEGQADAFVVTLQGTTCAEVRASAAASDLTTTALMALVNAIFLGGVVALMCRVWSAEVAAKAPKSLVARGVRRLSKRAASFRRRRADTKLVTEPSPLAAAAAAAAAEADENGVAVVNNPLHAPLRRGSAEAGNPTALATPAPATAAAVAPLAQAQAPKPVTVTIKPAGHDAHLPRSEFAPVAASAAAASSATAAATAEAGRRSGATLTVFRLPPVSAAAGGEQDEDESDEKEEVEKGDDDGDNDEDDDKESDDKSSDGEDDIVEVDAAGICWRLDGVSGRRLQRHWTAAATRKAMCGTKTRAQMPRSGSRRCCSRRPRGPRRPPPRRAAPHPRRSGCAVRTRRTSGLSKRATRQ